MNNKLSRCKKNPNPNLSHPWDSWLKTGGATIPTCHTPGTLGWKRVGLQYPKYKQTFTICQWSFLVKNSERSVNKK
jgi:hypothetical protein